ncbi:hypothetical protein F3Y22_tig00018999pilonHSYRG00017 [Hibiscus syriacus]|uniref:Uncharacterized protein n=1 Tax=Hibiscus syriacus TaxID=106335 RepID=A0A6A3BVH9_HIBSY|nr:hypothetical protein F3Y22_tig00018999pilonHSYRG00017 [Hibiscus syriacus]
MEQGKGTKSSSSQLFGSKVSPSSPLRIFQSLFPTQPKVQGEESPMARRQESPNEPLNANPENSEASSIYPHQCVQPCHLSSSIYYGGQDECPRPQTKQGSGIDTVYKDNGEDDSGYATRGNWWQGIIWISLLLSISRQPTYLSRYIGRPRWQFNPFLAIHGT